MEGAKRIEWISIMQSFAIVLVVMYHVQLVDKSTGMNHAFCEHISDIVEPFHMPAFFFVSGALLCLTRIERHWQTRRLYADKLRRLMVPMVFFVVVNYILKVAMNSVVKHPVEASLWNFVESFFIYKNHPSDYLWFLPTLMGLMLLYPFLRAVCNRTSLIAPVFITSVALWFVDLPIPEEWNVLSISHLNKYFVFFFSGVVTFKLGLYKRLNSWPALAVSGAATVAFYLCDIPLATSLAGICAIMSASLLAERVCGRLFSSFRNYIFPIYLMGIRVQAIVELLLWRMVFYDERFVVVFYVVNVLAGLYIPVLIAKLLEKSHSNLLKMCFGLRRS